MGDGCLYGDRDVATLTDKLFFSGFKLPDNKWVSYYEMDFDWDVIKFRGKDESDRMLRLLAGRHSKLSVWYLGYRMALRMS